jgi:phytol kinase
MNLIISVVIVFLLLCISETLWRHRDINTEFTRKFVHITAGSFVAFWSLYLSRGEIVFLSIAFVAVVVISKYANLFKAIHSVQRPTWGEIMFAATVGILAFVAHSHWIYCAALLNMSLADGLAAVFGMKFGKTTRYKVFGYAKSVVGTLTFFIVSMAILTGMAIFEPSVFSLWFIAIAVVATILENVAVRGLDNLLVPLFVAVALNVVR